jgi:hypothetical protein
VKDKISLIPFTGKIMGYNDDGQLEKEFDFLNGWVYMNFVYLELGDIGIELITK